MSSLIISYKNISSTNKILTHLDREQIKLNFYTNKLNYDIKNIQATMYQEILLTGTIADKNSTLSGINKSIKKLEAYATRNKSLRLNFIYTLTKIKSRIKSYQLVKKSLIEAIKTKDKIDIQDAIIGFDSITHQFAKDTQYLLELANAQLYQQLFILKNNNTFSANLIIFSFILSMILLGIAFYKFSTLQKNLQAQLIRAIYAEQEVKRSELKLLSYNQDLEKEVNKISKELHIKNYTHPISKLANRNQLLEDIKTYNFSHLAVLNIDKFQSFNDVYGEDIGNIALKLTGDFLNEQIKNLPLLLYHIGGDEFVIVCIQNITTNTQTFITTIENILENYKKHEFENDNKSFKFAMSAGIADTKDARMLAYADMALRDAKRKNIQLAFFNSNKDLEKTHKEDIKWRKKIEYALEHEGILSYYQPITPIQDKTKTLKYESLVRLRDEDGKIIAPFAFLEIAKQNKLYHKITYKVIENTLSTIEKYKINCSLNMSLADMGDDKTMQYLFNILKNYKYNHLLTIELLETEDFQNYDLVLNFCIKIKEYGIKIALDDFGSGYSNFSHALKLPIDYIKIDASIISNIDKDEDSKVMAETIVALAKRLKIETIAEFVATEEILNVITEIGVDYAQGYHLGKPLSISEHIKS